MADGYFDKLLDVISKSDKIGFGLVVAACGVFTARYIWPDKFSLLSNDTLGWVLFAGLLGAGLLFWSIVSWIGRSLAAGNEWFKQWKHLRKAPDKIDTLLPDEVHAVCWILANHGKRIYGNRWDEPFDGEKSSR